MKDGERGFGRSALKTLWAETVLGETSSNISGPALKNPFRQDDPLSEILVHLIAKATNSVVPSLVLRASPLPVAELCQLAILWAIAGFEAGASRLAHSIPLGFPTLWSKERDYSQIETEASVRLLQESLGQNQSGQIEVQAPFFDALKRRLPAIEPLNLPQSRYVPWTSFGDERIQGALTFSGSGVSNGAIRSETVQIPAFGPQIAPLSDSEKFGIRFLKNPDDLWSSPAFCPGVWYEMKGSAGLPVRLDTIFYGKPEEPLFFSFFVKADCAMVGSEKLQAKSLQRYGGVSQPVLFDDSLCIACDPPAKLEVIPLAGDKSFWGADYLAAFEIHPFSPKMSFIFSESPI